MAKERGVTVERPKQSVDKTVFVDMSAVWYISTRWDHLFWDISTRWDLSFWHISICWDLSCPRFISVEWEISTRWNVPEWEISTRWNISEWVISRGWDMPNCWHIYKYRNVHRLCIRFLQGDSIVYWAPDFCFRQLRSNLRIRLAIFNEVRMMFFRYAERCHTKMRKFEEILGYLVRASPSMDPTGLAHDFDNVQLDNG